MIGPLETGRPQFVEPRHRVAGVTLVEILVALAIGGLLIIGAVTVYMQSRNTYRVSETAARLQEVARYAMDVIEPDVREAGHWGMTNLADAVKNRMGWENAAALAAAVANNCSASWSVDLDRYVDGRESIDGGGSGYNLACAATNPVRWADVLVVRRASVNIAPLEAGRMQLQSNRIEAQIISNGVRPAGFTAAASETRNLIVNAYYINQEPADANGLPRYSLRRKALTGGAGGPSIQDEEIIPGVEDLQVEFGIDTDGSGSVDQYVEAESPALAAAVGQVMSVRLWLRVVSDEREVGFVSNRTYQYANRNFGTLNDQRRRVLVTKTIQLRNQQPNSI